MDSTGLAILVKELSADAAVAADAAEKAVQRLAEKSGGRLEACAYELARFYNVLERMFERLCEEFENHFEKRGDFHEKLVQRVGLDLEGIRPAFVPKERLVQVRELKGFRHLMRHAYDLVLREDRLTELARTAQSMGGELPGWCSEFERRVRAEQGW
jgi:hypothetical protein